jgi:hypothetical protein
LNAFHAVFSGVRAGVWLVQRGRLTAFLDVTPFLRVDLGAGARTIAELWADERTLAAWAAEMEDVDPWLSNVALELFWDPIAEQLAPLQAPLLEGPDALLVEFGELTPQALASRLRDVNPVKLGVRSLGPRR